MSELLPCAHCGALLPIVIVYPSPLVGYEVECRECHAKTARYDTEAEAIAAWNTRAERTCHIAYRDESHDTDAGFEHDGAYYCSECLRDLPDCVQCAWDDYQAGSDGKPIERCPNCGAKVVDE